MMWAFLSRRFRQVLLFTVAVPVLGRVAERLGETLESRGGETSVSRGLRRTGGWLERHERGPLARRRRR